jgi:uncharacterized protein
VVVIVNTVATVNNPTRSDNRLFHLNVGFLLKEGAGYSREFDFDNPGILHAEEVEISHLLGTLRLTRTPQGVLVQGTLHATTAVECVRCLKPFDLPFQVDLSELFVPEWIDGIDRDGQSPYTITEGGIINLTPIMREEGILAIPIHVLCKPDCKGLCPQCGQDLNQGFCNCEADRIDPRLASLRALLED